MLCATRLILIQLTDDAFTAKHMPSMGLDVKDFQVFNWKITNWKKLDKKLTSPEFECGGHKWYALASLIYHLMYAQL